MWMTLVWRFGLFAPLALIGASAQPCVRATLREDKGLGCAFHEGVAADGFFVDLDAEAGSGRHLDPAVARLERAGEERRLVLARRELDGQATPESRGHVEGGGQAGSEIERVRRDRQVRGLGERDDLPELGDAAHLGDAGLQDVPGPLADDLAEAEQRRFVLAE